jgi:hypothetical protein
VNFRETAAAVLGKSCTKHDIFRRTAFYLAKLRKAIDCWPAWHLPKRCKLNKLKYKGEAKRSCAMAQAKEELFYTSGLYGISQLHVPPFFIPGETATAYH